MMTDCSIFWRMKKAAYAKSASRHRLALPDFTVFLTIAHRCL
ncbi:hypothetical protein [Moraxella marmotae]